MNSIDDICVSDVSVISGIRTSGRGNDCSCTGRRSNGILYIWNGEAQFYSNNNPPTILKNGEVLFIPKGCRYKMQYTAPSTTFVVVNLEMFDKSGKDKKISEDIEIIAKDDASNRIAMIMRNLELVALSQNICATMRKKELVFKLLGVIFESNILVSIKNHKHPQIFSGVTLLEQTFLENISISEFAKVCNISVSLFRQLFKKQYNMSPVQYRNHLRISRAIEILSEGSSTVSEAAYASGFDNVGYFCRYYKKITGKTPKQTKECFD